MKFLNTNKILAYLEIIIINFFIFIPYFGFQPIFKNFFVFFILLIFIIRFNNISVFDLKILKVSFLFLVFILLFICVKAFGTKSYGGFNSLKEFFLFTSGFLAPLLYFVSLNSYWKSRPINFVLTWFVLLILFTLSSHSFDFSFLSFLTTFISQGSNLSSESIVCFFYLPFSLFFIRNKKWMFLSISILMMFMVGKRLPIFIVLFSFFIFNFQLYKLLSIKTLFISYFCFITLTFLTIICFAYGFFDNIIYNYLEVSPNQFSAGRYLVFSHIVMNYNVLNIAGYNLGELSLFTESLSYTNLTLVHSDILKIFIEFGVIFGLIIFGYYYYLFYYFNFDFSVLLIFLFSFVFLLISDNVFIYNSVQFYFFIIYFLSQFNEKVNLYRRS